MKRGDLGECFADSSYEITFQRLDSVTEKRAMAARTENSVGIVM